MKFTLAAAATLFATALASPVPRADDITYEIKDFSLHKLDGKITTLSFRILATNDGTLDFVCVPYDAVTDAATQSFEPNHVYACGKDSLFSFNYIPAHETQANELFLWQNGIENQTLGGNAFLVEPPCRALSTTPEELICEVPADVYIGIPMRVLGA